MTRNRKKPRKVGCPFTGQPVKRPEPIYGNGGSFIDGYEVLQIGDRPIHYTYDPMCVETETTLDIIEAVTGETAAFGDEGKVLDRVEVKVVHNYHYDSDLHSPTLPDEPDEHDAALGHLQFVKFKPKAGQNEH